MAKGLYKNAKGAQYRFARFNAYMSMWEYLTMRGTFSLSKKSAMGLTKAGAELWQQKHPDWQTKIEPIEEVA